jgi:hypothetical protein
MWMTNQEIFAMDVMDLQKMTSTEFCQFIKTINLILIDIAKVKNNNNKLQCLYDGTLCNLCHRRVVFEKTGYSFAEHSVTHINELNIWNWI